MTSQLEQLKAKTKKQAEVAAPVPAVEVVAEEQEIKYQHYSSSKQSVSLISPLGRKISFINFEHITCEESVIEYLDQEIKDGMRLITKGALMTREEADPMSALRKKFIKEYEAEKQAAAVKVAMGEVADMGKTDKNASINPSSTKDLTSNAAGSSSGVGE